MPNALKIGIVGCGGRMGQMLVRQVAGTEGCVLAGAVERPDSAAIGKDAGTLAGLEPLGVPVVADAAAMFAGVDVAIDFSAPAATAENALLAAAAGAAFVAGTTGLDAAQEATIARAAEKVAVMRAANMSVGVTLLLALTEQVARVLGPDYDIEILEMHHRHKVDAPSGTALALGEAAASGRGVDLATVRQAVRDGHTGPRPSGQIGFATLRGGDVAGEHTVIFAGDGERIEFTHRAGSRQIFAAGAVRAALWTRGRPAGLYSMKHVLGFAD